jgi:tRNA A37 threonylcarbamoyladenosine synthetase subunit TsaC/SUA5/YrdC
VIGVPTDTIYGIAGLVQNPEAIARIYDIKVEGPWSKI